MGKMRNVMTNKTMTKLLILFNALLFSLVLVGCDSKRNDDILKHFDLTDEKVIWNGDINNPNIRDDAVIVTLKRTETYPELKISDFELENATDMKYLGSVTMPENVPNPDKWRQSVIIYLIPEGKENLLETIRKLEQLEFVHKVEPSWINETA